MFLFCIYSKVAPRLEEQSSLFSPAVEEHGRSPRISYYGDYVIRTFAPDSVFVQLGFAGPNTYGALSSRNPLPSENLRLDFKFQLTPGDVAGDGVEFILGTKQYDSETKYGKTSRNDNIVLQISTKGKNPILKMYAAGNEQTTELKRSMYNNICTLRLENIGNTLVTSLSINDQSYKTLLTQANSGIEKNSYYTVITGNTRGYNIMRIYGIRANTMDVISDTNYPERKSSKLVWIVFITASVAIGYVLYNKQAKSQGVKS